jgi:hypothetical protein
MSTLIASRMTNGRRRRCNAKCYNAHGPDCDCICLAANYGVGERQAEVNTRELGVTWLDKASRIPSRRKRKFTAPPEQGKLFALPEIVTEAPAYPCL